jgi:hypothetical protein
MGPNCIIPDDIHTAGQGYTSATTTVYVRNIRIAPERPNLSSAVFSPDGFSLVVWFDAATNQARAAAPVDVVRTHHAALFRSNT